MADVKWIKLDAGIFDNRKIRQIESLPDGDTIVIIWLKLLCLAGEVNDSGLVYFTKEIPYTDQMLSSQFNRPLTIIQIALRTFEQFGMIEIINDILHISNWEKYQNIEGLDKIREQNRLRKQRQREREKMLPDVSREVTGHVTGSHVIEEEIDIEEEGEEKRRIDYNGIRDAYNALCPSLPAVKSLSDARKKAIKARLNTYSIEDLYEAFSKAEASDFLKGKNNNNWTANFDWILKDANLAKVLDGNYDNRGGGQQQNKTAKMLDESYRMMAEWAGVSDG